MVSEEALQIAEKREVIGKRERERYTQLNAVSEDSKERKESLVKQTIQRSRAKKI